MLIHTVVSGETLRTVAEAYGTSTRELLHLNELQSDNVIVPGQHLLIPGPATLVQPYTVKSGDTLEAVARRVGVSQANLERWLGARSTAGLNAGELLPVPKRITQKRAIEVNGYITPDGSASDARRVREVADRMTYVSVFSYQAKPDGTLTPQPDTQTIDAAKQGNVAPLMTVTNFDGSNFNTELAHTLMSNSSLRRKLIQNIVNTAKQRRYRGVNVDFEHMRPTDRALYNSFVQELAAACRTQKLSISIAMGPKTSDSPTASWMGAFDYKTLGEEVDFLMLMTYEWGWVGGPPMAVAPYEQVRAVIEYATSVIPSAKILMGMSLYGYDWRIPWQKGQLASGIANHSAESLAISEQVPILWGQQAVSPYFRYQGAGNATREVWFDDAMSVAAKMNLVYEFGLRGLSWWVLGNEFPQAWQLVRDTFEVKKI